jgi:hypothetical protein
MHDGREESLGGDGASTDLRQAPVLFSGGLAGPGYSAPLPSSTSINDVTMEILYATRTGAEEP